MTGGSPLILSLPARENIRPMNDIAARSAECVLCHTDIHPGNLFINIQGRKHTRNT
jgi:hypothetical protein